MKRFKLTTLWFMGFLLAVLTGSVCSCSSVNAHTTQYAGAPSLPPTQAANVRILRFEPAQPSLQLGEIVVNTTPSTVQPTGEVEDKLREEAAKLGADAVVVVDARIQQEGEAYDPYSSDAPLETVYGERVIAKAIKFETLPATGR